MNKLVVFLAVVGAAVAKPSILGAPLAYHSALIAPAAVSHTSRVDLNHSPILAHYGLGAPLLHAAPWAHAAPWIHAAPLAALPPHHPATILSPHGVPLDTIDVVAARAQHYQAKALASHGHYLKKRSILAAPLAYSAVWAPSAVSHQSRIDWNHHGHLYAAPLAYSAPLAHWGAGAYGVHPW